MVESIAQKGRGGGDKPVQKVKSDIVFCIDVSSSMIPCIDGVKENIRRFVEKIQSDPELNIEVRLGFLGHDSDHSAINFYLKEFTQDTEEFKRALTGLANENSEANLPALDWSLDFPWNRDAHKFVILFTDEPVEGGWDPAASRAKIEDLKNKIRDIGASVYLATFTGAEYSEYLDIAATDKCAHIPIAGYEDFEGAQFLAILEKLAKRVSTGSRGIANVQKPVEKDIYKVRPIATVTKK